MSISTFDRLPKNWRALLTGKPFLVRPGGAPRTSLADLARAGSKVDVFPKDQRTGRIGRVRLPKLLSALEQEDATWFVAQVALPTGLERWVPELPITAPGLRRPNLWVGSRGTHTPLHHDFMHNVVLQLDGRKRFTLIAPGDEDASYRRTEPGRSNYSQVSVPARFSRRRFPKFGRLEPLVVDLEPNDMLFMPAYWWHEVLTLTPSLMLNSWWPPTLDELDGLPLERMVFSEPEVRGTLVRYTNLSGLATDLDLARALARARRFVWSALVVSEVVNDFTRALAERLTGQRNLTLGTAQMVLVNRGALDARQRALIATVGEHGQVASECIRRGEPGKPVAPALAQVHDLFVRHRVRPARTLIGNSRVWLREAETDTSLYG